MKRSHPPLIKFYEAIWCIADERIEIQDNNWLFDSWVIEAKIFSSSKQKFYTVKYSESENAIMMNDNWAYWKWYLWYTWIALLLQIGKLELKREFLSYLKWIKRKDINTKNKNDFDKTKQEVDEIIVSMWWDLDWFQKYLSDLENKVRKLFLDMLWPKILPPEWY